MIEIIKQVRSIIQFEELEMRIGIHTVKEKIRIRLFIILIK